MNDMKPGKICISPIHDVNGSCFDGELIELVHFVNLAVGDNHHGRDASSGGLLVQGRPWAPVEVTIREVCRLLWGCHSLCERNDETGAPLFQLQDNPSVHRRILPLQKRCASGLTHAALPL
jgi:hypothetical protein